MPLYLNLFPGLKEKSAHYYEVDEQAENLTSRLDYPPCAENLNSIH